MTATIDELKRPLRNLIDNRLDGIDRILMEAGTPRAERGTILSDIEAQIYEMLHAAVGEQEPTRRDVLDVLAKLDPPEAYAPEEQGEKAAVVKPAPTISPTPPTPNLPAKGRTPPAGILACVGGLMTLIIGLPATILIALLLADDGELFLLALLLDSFILLLIGLPAFVLGILSALAIRNSNGTLDHITCAAIGITAFPLCLFSGAMLMAIIAESEFALVFVCFVFVTLGCVGAIHLVYRFLDATCLGRHGGANVAGIGR